MPPGRSLGLRDTVDVLYAGLVSGGGGPAPLRPLSVSRPLSGRVPGVFVASDRGGAGGGCGVKGGVGLVGDAGLRVGGPWVWRELDGGQEGDGADGYVGPVGLLEPGVSHRQASQR